MDIINKSYKRINAVNSDIFVVDYMDGDFVVFKNGGRCKLSTLLSEFEEISSVNEHYVNNDAPIDPEAFLNGTINENDPLLQQMELMANNPNAQLPESTRLRESVSLDDKYVKVAPGTSQAPAGGLADRLTQTDDTQSYANEGVQEANPTPRLPEWDVFDRVKKSDEIEILVPFKIKLPKAQKIDALNDMFETSFTMYLAKQYIKNNVVNNSIALQKTIQDAIEEWMDNELYGNSPKRKKAKTVRAKKTKEDVKTEITEAPEEVVQEVKEGASAMDMFNQNVPQWDGDLKKLFIINTEEQYKAVKARYNHLLENNPEHDERYRFEDMIEIYEAQVKDVQNGNSN